MQTRTLSTMLFWGTGGEAFTLGMMLGSVKKNINIGLQYKVEDYCVSKKRLTPDTFSTNQMTRIYVCRIQKKCFTLCFYQFVLTFYLPTWLKLINWLIDWLIDWLIECLIILKGQVRHEGHKYMFRVHNEIKN